MPEIQELLERTTPTTPPDFDVADLARRGRGRRRRAQVGTGLGAVALLAAAVAGIGALAPGGDQDQVVASRPPTGALAEAFAASGEPLGTWEQVADPPFSPRMGSFTGTASDGRVVVWGGSPSADGGGAKGGGVLTDGGVYDTESGAWEAIAPAPIPSGASIHWTELNDDRLLALGSTDGSVPVGAVYDLASGQWTEIDPPLTIELPVEGIAWTGDTLVLARFWSGADVDKVAQYTEPVVERWSYETGEWETGAAPPLSNRFDAYVSFDGEQLAVWGGVNQEVELGALATGATLVGDGAVYDVAADRWHAMAPGPLPPMTQGLGLAVWLEEGLAVAGGYIEDASGSVGIPSTGMRFRPVAAAAVYDPEFRTWSALPDPPSDRFAKEMGVPFVAFEELERPLLGIDPRQSGPHPIHVYDELTRSWIEAPLRDLHEVDGTLVTTSRTPDNPGPGPFEVQVLAGGVWEPATEAPFVNRMDAGVAVVDQGLLVVGGAEGPDLEITGNAWLLRFDATE